MKNPAFKSLLLASMVFGNNPAWTKTGDFGQIAYRSSCAYCHGIGGKGDGRIAADLKTKPTDLTVEAKNNKGEFPVESIYEIIDGRKSTTTSGPRHMPILGAGLFKFWA